MSDSSVHTTQLHRWLEDIRGGNAAARDELLRATCARLESLARKMLRAFPNVRRHAETGDVLQNALMRLLRNLQTVQPPSMRDFYNLAACLIRSELLDMARHFARANRNEVAPSPQGGCAFPEPAASDDCSAELERWERFHERWDGLPVIEREVVGLIFYHGRAQAEVAELLQISVRTVQRRWDSAMIKLHG